MTDGNTLGEREFIFRRTNRTIITDMVTAALDFVVCSEDQVSAYCVLRFNLELVIGRFVAVARRCRGSPSYLETQTRHSNENPSKIETFSDVQSKRQRHTCIFSA